MQKVNVRGLKSNLVGGPNDTFSMQCFRHEKVMHCKGAFGQFGPGKPLSVPGKPIGRLAQNLPSWLSRQSLAVQSRPKIKQDQFNWRGK